MKCYFLICGLLLIAASPLYAQDKLILTNGDLQEVTIKKVEPNTITFSYFGETLQNVMEKSEIAKIVFENGREQVFSASVTTPQSTEYENPPMNEKLGAVLPFAFVFDGEVAKHEGIEAQEFYYQNLMRKPERNTIDYQKPEITQRRLRAAGITDPEQYQDYEMREIAEILGVGVLVTGKITVDYRSTTSNSYGSTTVKVDSKKKKGKVYSSDYTTSTDEFDTKVHFKIYDKDGNTIVDVSRRPFLATTRNNYVSALNYLMKRTPYYLK